MKFNQLSQFSSLPAGVTDEAIPLLLLLDFVVDDTIVGAVVESPDKDRWGLDNNEDFIILLPIY